MTTKTSHKKKYLNQVVLAVILSGLGIAANAAELTIDNGEVTLGAKSSTVASTGLATQVTGVPNTNKGIPSFTFDMTPSNLTDGTFKFKLGVTFDDDNSNSRIEVYIPSLDLTVSNSGARVDGVLDNTQKIRVLARDDDGSINVNVLLNIPADSPITVSNNAFSFDMGKILTAITNDHASIKAILDGIGNIPRHYTYTIAMQETTAGAIRLGVGDTFAAFPRIQSSCAANTSSQSNAVFTLGSNALASDLTLAYAIRGQYSVTGASGSAGSAPTAFTEDCAVVTPTPTPEPEVTEEAVTETNTEIENELAGETVSTETVDKLNTAADTAATLASNTAEQINNAATLTPEAATTALTTLTTVSKSIELAGTATQKNAAIDTSKAASTITNVASTLEAINTKSTTGGTSTLTEAQKTQVNTLVTNVVKDAANLIATGASSTNILTVVNASIKVIAQGAKANGEVTATVVAQVKTLTEKAVSGVIKNLSATALAGADTSTPAGLKALMVANPSVLEVALAASANLPTGTSVNIGGVSLTVEEILALNLAGGAGAGEGLQGGFNFQAATTGFTVTTDSTTGNMTLSNGTEKYVAASPVSRLVPDSVPEGISYRPNGSAVLVGNGVATDLAPTAFDQTAFSSAVTSAGFQVTYRSNGTINIALGGNERFSGAFAYDNLGSATSCGAVSVTAPTGNPAAPDYAFMVKCADGVTQRVTPIPDNTSFYATLANADLNASTNRNTGVITIKTVGSFKPSFFVTPLSLTDTTYYNAIKNADGIAFRASDKNGDGKTDYEVLSADGVQILYGQ